MRHAGWTSRDLLLVGSASTGIPVEELIAAADITLLALDRGAHAGSGVAPRRHGGDPGRDRGRPSVPPEQRGRRVGARRVRRHLPETSADHAARRREATGPRQPTTVWRTRPRSHVSSPRGLRRRRPLTDTFARLLACRPRRDRSSGRVPPAGEASAFHRAVRRSSSQTHRHTTSSPIAPPGTAAMNRA